MADPFSDKQRLEIEVLVRENLAETLTALGKSLTEGAKKAGELDSVFGKLTKTISGPAGAAAAVLGMGVAVGKMFADFGESRQQLHLFAESARLPIRDLTALESTLRIAGFSSEQARSSVTSVVSVLKDIWQNQWGSSSAAQMSEYGRAAQNAFSRINDAMAKGDPKDGIKQMIKEWQGGGPRLRAVIEQTFHVDKATMEEWSKNLEKVYKDIPVQDDKATLEMQEKWNEFKEYMEQHVWEPMVNTGESVLLRLAKAAGIKFGEKEEKEGGAANRGGGRSEEDNAPNHFGFDVEKKDKADNPSLLQGLYGLVNPFYKPGAAQAAPTPSEKPASSFKDRWAVPGMAEGGAVMGPVHALIGEKEPELIVPFSKLKDIQSMIGGSQIRPAGDPRLLDAEQDITGILGDVRDTLQRMEASPLAKFAEGGIVTKPTRALIGEKGPEMVIPIPQAYNNPGNIKWGKWAMAHGAIGRGARGGHAVFGSSEEGMGALQDLVQERIDKGQTTIRSFQYNKTTGPYAETDEGKPDPKWAAGVSRVMGIGLDDRIPSPSAFAYAVARQEGFFNRRAAAGGGDAIPTAWPAQRGDAIPTAGPAQPVEFAQKMDEHLTRRRGGNRQIGTVSADVEFTRDERSSRKTPTENVFKPVIVDNIRQGQLAGATTSEPYTWALSP